MFAPFLWARGPYILYRNERRFGIWEGVICVPRDISFSGMVAVFGGGGMDVWESEGCTGGRSSSVSVQE